MVEHSAVNRRVAGSSPARGASTPKIIFGVFIFMSYYVYILKSLSSNNYYIGSSDNPQRRLFYHNSIEKGFTSRFRPWIIVYQKQYETKEQALIAERKIKSWKSSKMIEKLITENYNI